MTEFVCGTGNWAGPKPGDPDNNAILSAVGVFGGIEVSWTYPNTNSHAVAHTLLYRSIGDRFETAIQVAIVSGNYFFDRNTVDPIKTYYYWIRFVSINGTLLEPIGPATGYALNDLDRVIEGMAGKIEAGALATSLRSRIDKIADLEVGVTNLSQTISDESSILSQTLQGVQSDIDDALGYYEQEREARLLADGALASAINTTVAQAKDELYAAVQESTDAQALVNGDLSAKYSVKVDLAGNVAGFGLASTGNVYDETIHSEFGVQADSFWVSGPSTVSTTAPLTNLYHGRVWVDTSDAENPVTKYYNKTTGLWQTTVVKGVVPFIVRSSPDPVTGAPAGVYIDSAYIETIKANQIDSRGLSIKDTAGNVILAAGNALDWGMVGGTGKPADSATNGSNLVSKPTFGNGSVGSWANGVKMPTADVAGGPFAGYGEIRCYESDTYGGHLILVTPGETLFCSGFVWSGLSTYGGSIGVAFKNASGNFFDWRGASYAAGQQWHRVSAAVLVPDGAVSAEPWLQIGSDNGVIVPYVAFSDIYVGRQEMGATVGMLSTESSTAYTASNGWSINKDGSFSAIGGGNKILVGTDRAVINFNKPDGTAAFAVDNTGSAVFGGSLLGATGTFSGALSAGVLDSAAFDSIKYTYNTPGTYQLTIPSKKSGWSTLHMRVTVVGAGGGGGGGAAATSSTSYYGGRRASGGGGGGAGQKNVYTISSGVTSGNSISVTVGSPGSPGAKSTTGGANVAASPGGTGGSSFVTINANSYSAAGGNGGGGGTGTLADSYKGGLGGSLGGTAGSGYLMGAAPGGAGGSSEYGMGGSGGSAAYASASPGVAGGSGAGGGGGGADHSTSASPVAANGGRGGPGYVLVEFYDPNTIVLNSRYAALVNWLDSIGHGTVPAAAR